MTAPAIRAIAALVMAIVAATPVARLLCAHDCFAASHAPASTSAGEHCHQTEASDGPTMTAVAPAACAPFALTSVATRERAAAPLASAPLAPPYLQVRELLHQWPNERHRERQSLAPSAGPSPGSPLPLRI